MHELLAPAVGSAAVGWLAYFQWRATRPWRRATWRPKVGERAPPLPPLPSAAGPVLDWGAMRGRKGTVLVFMANRCPGVKAYEARLVRLQAEFGPRGVNVVGINPIDEALYSSETLGRMREAAHERGFNFAYVKDADQEATRLYDAQCTPQAFVLDGRDRLAYAGRIDNAFVEAEATRHYVRDAMASLASGTPVRTTTTIPLGCAIDRKPASRGGTRASLPAPVVAPEA